MHNNITLSIPAERAFEYQKAILAVLAKVEVGECEAIYKEHIKTVYELLKELNTEHFSITKPENTTHPERSPRQKPSPPERVG